MDDANLLWPCAGGREAGAGTEPVQAPPSLSVAVATVQLGAPKIEISASGATIRV